MGSRKAERKKKVRNEHQQIDMWYTLCSLFYDVYVLCMCTTCICIILLCVQFYMVDETLFPNSVLQTVSVVQSVTERGVGEFIFAMSLYMKTRK